MLSLNHTKIECVSRYIEVNPSFWYDLTDWLLNLKLITSMEFSSISRRDERARFVVKKLESLLYEDKLLLVDYEWIKLPTEFIRINIITTIEQREFSCSPV